MGFIPAKAPNPGVFKSRFEKGVKGVKLASILVFLTLVYVNKNTNKWVTENPRYFMSNNIAIALAGALASGFIAWNRKVKIFKEMFLGFLFFFFFQVVREFSGWYQFTGQQTLNTPDINNQRKPLISFAMITALITGLFFIYTALKVRQKPPSGTRYPFLTEIIVFSIILIIGEAIVSATHFNSPKEITKTSIEYFIFYIIIALLLQYGGYYEKVFKSD
jgi:hypothetical protein